MLDFPDLITYMYIPYMCVHEHVLVYMYMYECVYLSAVMLLCRRIECCDVNVNSHMSFFQCARWCFLQVIIHVRNYIHSGGGSGVG